ncbi:MAG: hypothetical protein H0W73_06020 [Bacteroidetes bacterium]|nr:hypothetical protein [Bacteroidota bacterium]
MKNKIALCIAFLVTTTFANAQDNKSSSSSSGGQCFDESTKIINIGVAFGGYYYRYNRGLGYTYRITPAINLSYEQALKNKVGPGFIGLGAYFGYQHASLRYNDYYYNGNQYYYRHSWNYMLISLRGAYHADALNFEEGEVYFGATVGVRLQTYNYESNSLDPNKDNYQISGGSVYPSSSVFVGGRWYFTNKIGVFGEISYGYSYPYLTAGLSIKL